jgi:hypothetical protein
MADYEERLLATGFNQALSEVAKKAPRDDTGRFISPSDETIYRSPEDRARGREAQRRYRQRRSARFEALVNENISLRREIGDAKANVKRMTSMLNVYSRVTCMCQRCHNILMNCHSAGIPDLVPYYQEDSNQQPLPEEQWGTYQAQP